jgi:hypothetical protein
VFFLPEPTGLLMLSTGLGLLVVLHRASRRDGADGRITGCSTSSATLTASKSLSRFGSVWRRGAARAAVQTHTPPATEDRRVWCKECAVCIKSAARQAAISCGPGYRAGVGGLFTTSARCFRSDTLRSPMCTIPHINANANAFLPPRSPAPNDWHRLCSNGQFLAWGYWIEAVFRRRAGVVKSRLRKC